MKKPKPHSKKYFDYTECRNYLQNKYKYNERDYLEKFTNRNKYLKEALKIENANYIDLSEDLTKSNPNDPEVKRKLEVRKRVYATQKEIEPEYKDFWHWVVDNFLINNGCFMYWNNETLEFAREDWQKKIIEYYLSEFGGGENREIEFYISW